MNDAFLEHLSPQLWSRSVNNVLPSGSFLSISLSFFRLFHGATLERRQRILLRFCPSSNKKRRRAPSSCSRTTRCTLKMMSTGYNLLLCLALCRRKAIACCRADDGVMSWSKSSSTLLTSVLFFILFVYHLIIKSSLLSWSSLFVEMLFLLLAVCLPSQSKKEILKHVQTQFTRHRYGLVQPSRREVLRDRHQSTKWWLLIVQ